jgi:adenylylsulfate kinase-like enzyme
MSAEQLPVLWIWGPPGVGKTTVGWEIWSELAAAGITAGYLDIDQLGMSEPAPADDPHRYRRKAQNLAAVIPHYGAAGAQIVVVSGTCGIEHARAFAENPAVTLCRLRLDHDELRRRLSGRGWDPGMIADALAEATQLDASTIADVSVDTTGLSVAEVIRSLRRQVGDWPRAEAPTSVPAGGVSALPGDIVWLCGPTGVGKSTIGWEVFARAAWADGRRAALIDLQQIGFLEPASADDPDNHRLKARNLAAMWSTLRTDGTDCLVIVGAVDEPDQIRTYTDALPAATFTLIRLQAGRDQLAERIARRGAGEGPRLPGDRLYGRDAADLARVADRAAADTVRLAHTGIGDVVIDTDELTIDETTNAVRRHLGH